MIDSGNRAAVVISHCASHSTPLGSREANRASRDTPCLRLPWLPGPPSSPIRGDTAGQITWLAQGVCSVPRADDVARLVTGMGEPSSGRGALTPRLFAVGFGRRGPSA